MALLIQWNLGRGFLQYVNDRDAEHAQLVVTRLSQRYEQDGNWEWVRDGKDWRRLTGPDGPSSQRPPPRPPRLDNDGRRPPPRGPRGPRGNRPGPPRGPSMDLGPRLTLFDAQKIQIKGRRLILERPQVRRHPIIVEGRTVGWLAYKPLTKVRSTRDIDFLRQQSQSFLLTSALILLAAGLLGLLLARHLTGPLLRLKSAVAELAHGNFSTRVQPSSSDEIADLSHDVNALAHTLGENLSARQRWIADISHELRTPLSIIQGEVEALRDGVREVTPETLDSVHEEVKRLGKLINDLHELSMSDAGALNYKFEPINIAALLAAEVEKFVPAAAKKELTLTFKDSSTTVQTASIDELRIKQLIGNLIENSLRYTDPGGRIVVSLDAKADQVVITVADTAPSVTPDDCEKLFERLYRVDGSRARASGGSGLGLAIVKNIALAHQGKVLATPSDIGGLAVTVELSR